MDDVLLRCAKKRLKDPLSVKEVQDRIKQNSGFHYEYNFRRLLVLIIGLINVERLERSLDQPKFAQMSASLGSLKMIRNAQAHTHTRGVTTTLNAPSWTISQFTLIYDGLIDIDDWLRKAKF